MLRLELTQLATVSVAARQAVPDPGADQISERQRKLFFEALLDEGKASQPLRRYLEAQLGRATSSPTPAPQPTPSTTKKTPLTTQLPRRICRDRQPGVGCRFLPSTPVPATGLKRLSSTVPSSTCRGKPRQRTAMCCSQDRSAITSKWSTWIQRVVPRMSLSI